MIDDDAIVAPRVVTVLALALRTTRSRMLRATTRPRTIAPALLALAMLALTTACSTPAPRPDPKLASAGPSHAAVKQGNRTEYMETEAKNG